MGKLLGVVNNFLHHTSTSPTIFHRNVSFEIKITLSHYEIFHFLFLSCKNIQGILWKIISTGRNAHPTPEGHCLIFQYFKTSLSIIWYSFVSNLKEETWTQYNGAKQGKFINNVSKYRKIVGDLFKGKWYELGHFVAQLLEWCK